MIGLKYLENFSEYDVISIMLYVIGAVITTAGLDNLYGWDLTASYGLDLFTIPIIAMLGAVTLVLVTNSIEAGEILDMENIDGTTVGFVMAVVLPVLHVVDPQFYADLVNDPLSLVFVFVGVVGLVILSDDGSF